MRKSYIYKTIDNDLIYVNNLGNEYLLTEAVSPLGDGTYDIITAFPKRECGDDEDILFNAECVNLKWFCGACYVKDYMSGKSKELLTACHDYLDEEPTAAAEDEHPNAEIFYTGGGIYCGILKVADGWFMGETNGWGSVYTSYEAAVNGNTDLGGVVRNITDINEQIAIWVRIYTDAKVREENIDLCNSSILYLTEDLSIR